MQRELRLVKQNAVFMSDAQSYNYNFITSFSSKFCSKTSKVLAFAAVSLKTILYGGLTCLDILYGKKLNVIQARILYLHVYRLCLMRKINRNLLLFSTYGNEHIFPL